MAKLSRDLQALRAKLSTAKSDESVVSLQADGPGTVKLGLARSQNGPVAQVAIIFADDTYPNAAVLLLCEGNDSFNSQLEDLSDEFQDGSDLAALVSAICARLDFPTCLSEGSTSSGAAEMDRDEEAEGSQADQVSFDGSEAGDADDTDDDAYAVAERDDEELLKTVFQKVSRWEHKEASRIKEEDEEAAAAAAAGTGGGAAGQGPSVGLSMQERLAQQRQIFNPREAFSMLSRELKDIMRQNDPMLEVDTVDNDVYFWDIHLYRFEGGRFAEGIQRLNSQHGCGFVHLRLHFKRGLHPFYPPTAELLWPRCQGPFVGALSSHPMIQLRSWDPWKPIKELIIQLRVFMEAAADVDVEHHSKPAAQASDAAYTPFERQLAQLEALSQVPPLCISHFPQLYSARDAGVDQQRMEALLPSSKRQKKEGSDAEKKTFWASGTGYGSGSRAGGEQWDAKGSEAAQAARDAELQGLLDSIAGAFATELGSLDLEQQIQQLHLGPSKPGTRRGTQRAQSSQCSLPEEVEALIETVAGSSLLPFLERELAKVSFTDLCSRATFYRACLEVLHKLCCGPAAKLLWLPCCPQPTAGSSNAESQPMLFGVLGQLQKQAAQYLSVMQSVKVPDAAAPAPPSSSTDDQAALREEEERSSALAELILQIYQRSTALAAARSAGAAPAQATGRTTRSAAAQAAVAAARPRTNDELDHAYEAAMSHLKMDSLKGIAADRHHYAKTAEGEGVKPRKRMQRLAKELTSLSNDLPINRSSSVFVRADEDHLECWQMLITGPDATPYSGGCFLFDVYFPTDYPNAPPKVNLRTTGAGSVRFNPNLYNCGKVCLSLLGTWSGEAGESWNPVVSSLLQVAISIQSLILVDQPYFNEPGYEAEMGSDTGRRHSAAYNTVIRQGCMKWAILDMVKSPPKAFEEVVKTHFRFNQDKILETCKVWADEGGSKDSKLLTEIRTEFQKL